MQVPFNLQEPCVLYIRRAKNYPLDAPFYIYSTNSRTEYFKHAVQSPFFSLQNAVYFIMLPCLVSVLLTFYIQGVLKFEKKSVAKRLMLYLHVVCGD